MADLIYRGGLLCEAQRMAQRQYLDAGADLHAFGARRDGAGNRQRRGADRPIRSDMNFREPHRIQTPALGGFNLFERVGEGLRLALSRRTLKLVKHAEFERHSRFSLLSRADTLRLMKRRCQPRKGAGWVAFVTASSSNGLPGHPVKRRRVTA